MKFRYKIVLFFLILYLGAVVLINAWIFQNNRSNMLESEVSRNLNIEETLYLNLAFNLKFNSEIQNKKTSFSSFSNYFVKTFGSDLLYITISDYNDIDLTPSILSIPISPVDLDSFKKNTRSYILKHNDGSFYMVIYRKFQYENNLGTLK